MIISAVWVLAIGISAYVDYERVSNGAKSAMGFVVIESRVTGEPFVSMTMAEALDSQHKLTLDHPVLGVLSYPEGASEEEIVADIRAKEASHAKATAAAEWLEANASKMGTREYGLVVADHQRERLRLKEPARLADKLCVSLRSSVFLAILFLPLFGLWIALVALRVAVDQIL